MKSQHRKHKVIIIPPKEHHDSLGAAPKYSEMDEINA
jgi:hypothetical protein